MGVPQQILELRRQILALKTRLGQVVITGTTNPAAHAATHADAGSDPVNVTTLDGFPGGTTNFLRADGTFAAPSAGSGITQLTGDVTAGPGSGSQAATIAADAVTNAKLADEAQATVKGRAAAAGTGNPTDLTANEVSTILDTATDPFVRTSAAGAAYTDEKAQDAVGAMVDTTLEYVDATPLLRRAALTGDVTATAGSNATTIANDAVTYAKIQNVSAASKLLGRGSAGGSGDTEEITIGSNLTLSGTTLSAVVGTPGSGALLDYKVIVKGGNETVNNSSTFQSDDDLNVSIGASETWMIEWNLFINGNNTPDFKYAVNVPTGATGFLSGIRLTTAAASATDAIGMSATTDLTDTGARQGGTITGATVFCRPHALVINSTNAGTVTLRWAQQNADPTNTVVLAGSFVEARRVA